MTDAALGVLVPHRSGCPCVAETAQGRCYPCSDHPSEILTARQWAAMESLYRGTHWTGIALAAEIKGALRRENERLANEQSYRPMHDHALGLEALYGWLGYPTVDLVAAVRHYVAHQDDETGGGDCEPDYDDPECIVGTCEHLPCMRERGFARERAYTARWQAQPHIFHNEYIGQDLVMQAAVSAEAAVAADRYPCNRCTLPLSASIHHGAYRPSPASEQPPS